MKTSLVFVLVSLRSLYNVGSIFRTADALGVEKIYLTGFTGTPQQSKVAKTALGAEKEVAWEKKKSTSEVIRQLKKEGYELIPKNHKIDTKKYSYSVVSFDIFYKEHEK